MTKARPVYHEVVPPAAKWRMGLAERHGAVLKLLIMKTMVAATARGFDEVSQYVLSAVAARNRQVRVGGFSPTQIVLGKDVAIPSSLLDQLETGHFKYVMNQDLAFDKARRRNAQIRQRRKLSFGLIPVRLCARPSTPAADALGWRCCVKGRWFSIGILHQAEKVCQSDFRTKRHGRAPGWWRHLRDVVELSSAYGFATAIRNSLKGLSLEYVRLAALQEVESSKVCAEALKVERELQGSRPNVEEMVGPAPDVPLDPAMSFSGDEEPVDERPSEPPGLKMSVLDDVPAQLHRERREMHLKKMDPDQQRAKKVRFEDAKKDTEEHLGKMKDILWKYEPTPPEKDALKTKKSEGAPPPNYQIGESSSSSTAPPHLAMGSHRGRGVLHARQGWHLDEATRGQRKMMAAARHGWSAYALEMMETTMALEAPESVEMPVTGKPRLEYRWRQLDERRRVSFEEPLKKAVDVYVDNDAIEPVPLGYPVPPEKVLPSRFVLTSKGEGELPDITLKARWVLAGHLDKEAGQHAMEAPTASWWLITWCASSVRT